MASKEYHKTCETSFDKPTKVISYVRSMSDNDLEEMKQFDRDNSNLFSPLSKQNQRKISTNFNCSNKNIQSEVEQCVRNEVNETKQSKNISLNIYIRPASVMTNPSKEYKETITSSVHDNQQLLFNHKKDKTN